MEPTLDKGDDQSYSVDIRVDSPIRVRELETGLFFESVLGAPDEKDELFELLMEANFMGSGTGHCYLGLDLDGKRVKLMMTTHKDSGYAEFKDGLEEFANYVDYWKAEIAA